MASPNTRRETDLTKLLVLLYSVICTILFIFLTECCLICNFRLMSDRHTVEMINDSVKEFNVSFNGPADSKLLNLNLYYVSG